MLVFISYTSYTKFFLIQKVIKLFNKCESHDCIIWSLSMRSISCCTRPRSSCQEVFCKKFRKIHRKTPVPRPVTLLKKRLLHRCFPVNFAKFLRTPFSFFFRNGSVVLTSVFSQRSYISEKRIYQKFISKIIFTWINFIAFIAFLLPIEKMDIRGFLNRSNKKGDLRSGSKEYDEPKRQREEKT